jgi:hypothetical protein
MLKTSNFIFIIKMLLHSLDYNWNTPCSAHDHELQSKTLQIQNISQEQSILFYTKLQN